MKAKRGRNFACIIYPDSENFKEDFRDIVKSWHVTAFLSPLHDSDTNDDGEIKKRHYHLLLKFDGNKSESQVRELFDSIDGVGLEFVDSFRGYARYLCHLDEDDPHKPKYSVSDVWSNSDFQYCDVINSQSDILEILKDILSFIDTYHITLFCELVKYAGSHEPDWFKVLVSGYTVFISQYLKSSEYGASHRDLYRLKD